MSFLYLRIIPHELFTQYIQVFTNFYKIPFFPFSNSKFNWRYSVQYAKLQLWKKKLKIKFWIIIKIVNIVDIRAKGRRNLWEIDYANNEITFTSGIISQKLTLIEHNKHKQSWKFHSTKFNQTLSTIYIQTGRCCMTYFSLMFLAYFVLLKCFNSALFY